MRGIFNIAITQVLQQLRERGAIITLFVVPIIMMVAIGSFNRPPTASGPVIDVVWPAGGGSLTDKFVATLRADGDTQARFVVCEPGNPGQPEACQLDKSASVIQRLEQNIASATVILPATFDSDLRAGKPVAVQVNTKNDIQLSQTITGYVNAVNTRIGGAVLAAHVATKKEKGDAAFFETVLANAQTLWDKDPVQIQETYSTITGTEAGTGFGQSAPGIGAMFVLFNVMTLTQVFITERKNWTLQRLLIMPLRRWQILAGKLFGQYLIGLMTFAVMLIAGYAFGVRWGDPLGVVATVLVYTLAVTALAMAVSTLVRTVNQAGGIGLLVGLVMAPLGGAWWPLNITPQFMQTIGRVISPIAWSQEAFNNMVFYGATFVDILPQLGVLLLFAVVFFAFGLSRFRFD